MHDLTQPQWTDRFLNRLSQLLPTVSVADIVAWAVGAYPGTEGPGPEESAELVASDLAPPAEDLVKPQREAVLRLNHDVPLTPAACARGIVAARLVLDQAGIGTCEAARASFRREGWEMRDHPVWLKPTTEEHRAADVWLAACAAARAVSGGGDLWLETEPLEPGVVRLIFS